MAKLVNNLSRNWTSLLKSETESPYFNMLEEFLQSEINDGKSIYPPAELIFNAYNMTSFKNLKIVVIGQDPYHNPGEAMGLSFSVPQGNKIPPSLRNIYKELNDDLGFAIPDHGNLTKWADQGVLLINAFLTVEHNKPGSHRKIGWDKFTDATIHLISEMKEHVVFMLWGNFAKSKLPLINVDKHLVLEAAHPSPLARGAYFGSKHFSKANNYLESHGYAPIDWRIINITPSLFDSF